MNFYEKCKSKGLEVYKYKKTLPIYLVKSVFSDVFLDLKLPESGWGNGYVAIPEYHSLYGVSFEDLHSKGIDIGIDIPLTYSGIDEGSNKWLFGFDTNHSFNNKTHDFNYVKNQAILLRNFLFLDKQYQRFIKTKRLINILKNK